MLMDYINEPQTRRAPPEGVQVAGLLDFFELAARQGRKFLPDGMAEIMDYARRDPTGLYRENNLFVDPRGDLTMNTGLTYQGRTVPRRNSIDQLKGSGAATVNLRQYLDGTQIGDIFGSELDNINIGRVPAQGYDAAFISPTTTERGVLAINENIPKDQIGPLFEHELQHALQKFQNKPQGANPDMLSDYFFQYMTSERGLDPNVIPRIDTQASTYGISPSTLRYYATRGETEATAAENIGAQVLGTGKQLTAPPPISMYTRLPSTMPLTGIDPKMIYDLPQNVYDDYLKFRKSMQPPPFGSVK